MIVDTPALPGDIRRRKAYIEMLNILVWKFENKLFSVEVTVGFY